MKNRTQHPIGVVLSIDGANTLDVTEPVHGSIIHDDFWVLTKSSVYYHIDGWQASESEALQFIFTTRLPGVGGSPGQNGFIRASVYFPNNWESVRDELLASRFTVVVMMNSIDLPGEVEVHCDLCLMDPDRSELLRTGMERVVPQPVRKVPFSSLTIRPVEEILISYNADIEAFLGVVVRSLGTFGVKIVYVIPGSAADRAGLQPGQIISRVDGYIVKSVGHLRDIIVSKKPGDTVLLYLHDKDRVFITALPTTLGQW